MKLKIWLDIGGMEIALPVEVPDEMLEITNGNLDALVQRIAKTKVIVKRHEVMEG